MGRLIVLLFILLFRNYGWSMEVHWLPEMPDGNYYRQLSSLGGSENVSCQVRVREKDVNISTLNWSGPKKVKRSFPNNMNTTLIPESTGWMLMVTDLEMHAFKKNDEGIYWCNFASPNFNGSTKIELKEIPRNDNSGIKLKFSPGHPQWLFNVNSLEVEEITLLKTVANKAYVNLTKFPEKYNVNRNDTFMELSIKNATYEDWGNFTIEFKTSDGKLFRRQLAYRIRNLTTRNYMRLNKKRFHPRVIVRAAINQGKYQWRFKESKFQNTPETNTPYRLLWKKSEIFYDGNEKFDEVSWIPSASGWLACLDEANSSEPFDVMSGLEYVCITEMNSSLSMEGPQEVEKGDNVSYICKADGCDFAGDEIIRWYHKSPNENGVRIELSSAGKAKMEVNVLVSNLTIRSFSERNTGTYYCELTSQRFVLRETLQVTLMHGSLRVYIFVAIPLVVFAVLALAFWLWLRSRIKKSEMLFERHFKTDDKTDIPLTDQLPADKKWAIPFEKLTIGQRLGSGQFGVVHEASVVGMINNELHPQVAVKVIRHRDERTVVRCLVQEFKIMSHIGRHEFVLRLLGAFVSEENFGLVLEYCKFGCLLHYILENRYRFVDNLDKSSVVADEDSEYCRPLAGNEMAFNTSILVGWSYQIARGMQWLASRMVTHGDLAARNILLTKNNIIKISDFGLASKYENLEYFKRRDLKLPVKWMAVESISKCKFSTETDVWSYGVTLWEIFSLGRTPYSEISAFNMESTLKSGYRLGIPEYAPKNIYDLMRSCWMEAPDERPSFTTLALHFSQFLGQDFRITYLELEAQETAPTAEYRNLIAQIRTGADVVYVRLAEQTTRF